MIQTDIPGVTCSDRAIEGSATLAMAASSTTSTIAASTEAIAAVWRSLPELDVASSVGGVDRTVFRSASPKDDVGLQVIAECAWEAMSSGINGRPVAWARRLVMAYPRSTRRSAPHT